MHQPINNYTTHKQGIYINNKYTINVCTSNSKNTEHKHITTYKNIRTCTHNVPITKQQAWIHWLTSFVSKTIHRTHEQIWTNKTNKQDYGK